jgi:hypothetical protein
LWALVSGGASRQRKEGKQGKRKKEAREEKERPPLAKTF